MSRLVRIGTRSSQLSLWQARHVAALIQQHQRGARVELREYRTRGDRLSAQPLPSIGGKGVFTQALEAALLKGEIDCAAHSLKDLPVADTPGLALAAIPQRGDHRDALVSRHGEMLAQLPQGARIGTGSPRRRAQLLALRPDLQVIDIRGNVPTRLDKLLRRDSDYDALVLAAAGLNRLDLAAHGSEIFSDAQMLCAPGQGALAVQCRAEDVDLYSPLSHQPSALAVAAERGFLGGLQAGCALPVGAHATVKDGALVLHGRVISLAGSAMLDFRGERSFAGSEPLMAARELGESLALEALRKGAGDLLAEAR